MKLLLLGLEEVTALDGKAGSGCCGWSRLCLLGTPK